MAVSNYHIIQNSAKFKYIYFFLLICSFIHSFILEYLIAFVTVSNIIIRAVFSLHYFCSNKTASFSHEFCNKECFHLVSIYRQKQNITEILLQCSYFNTLSASVYLKNASFQPYHNK